MGLSAKTQELYRLSLASKKVTKGKNKLTNKC